MSLAGGIRSVEEPAVNPNAPPIKRVLPELYDLWVKKLRLFGAREKSKHRSLNGNETLLDTGDIKPGEVPESLFNSKTLTMVARASLSTISPGPASKPLPFFTEPTHLFLTRSNLDGIARPVSFGKMDGYIIPSYEGRAHFAVTGLGSRKFPKETSQWLGQCSDRGDRINVGDLGKLAGQPADQAFEAPFEALTQATLTTSAVPIVFAARQILGMMDDDASFAAFGNALKNVEGLADPMAEQPPQGPDGPRAPLEWPRAICVDGGTMNNEPFELVRWTIRDLDQPENSRAPETSDRAVIMIAPFPPKYSGDGGPIDGDRNMDMGTIGKMMAKAFFYQARYKATDLVAALDPGVYSRYLISPKRDPNLEKPQLATALLHAAGGFLDEQFREHDFQLGRRNCQRFLSTSFVLHPSNPVFGFEAKAAAPGTLKPIIPLFGSAKHEIPLPVWPQMPRHQLVELRRGLQHRFDKFVGTAITGLLKDNGILRIIARVWWWWRRQVIVEKAVTFIKADLENNDQIAGPAPTTHNLKKYSWVMWLLILLALAVGLFLLYERWLETI